MVAKRRVVQDVEGVIYSPLEDRARIQGTGIEPWLVAMTYETAKGDWQSVRESFDWLREDQLQAAIAFARANPEMVAERIDREKETQDTMEEFWRKYPQTDPKNHL
jgi:uncharacterized protein (DUF433 family)